VWGIRGILVPSNITFTTLVDIGLGLVIAFLLAGMTWRELLFLAQRNHLWLPWLPTPQTAPDGTQRPADAPGVTHGDEFPGREQEPR